MEIYPQMKERMLDMSHHVAEQASSLAVAERVTVTVELVEVPEGSSD